MGESLEELKGIQLIKEVSAFRGLPCMMCVMYAIAVLTYKRIMVCVTKTDNMDDVVIQCNSMLSGTLYDVTCSVGVTDVFCAR
jgi:hypothetical protein